MGICAFTFRGPRRRRAWAGDVRLSRSRLSCERAAQQTNKQAADGQRRMPVAGATTDKLDPLSGQRETTSAAAPADQDKGQTRTGRTICSPKTGRGLLGTKGLPACADGRPRNIYVDA